MKALHWVALLVLVVVVTKTFLRPQIAAPPPAGDDVEAEAREILQEQEKFLAQVRENGRPEPAPTPIPG